MFGLFLALDVPGCMKNSYCWSVHLPLYESYRFGKSWLVVPHNGIELIAREVTATEPARKIRGLEADPSCPRPGDCKGTFLANVEISWLEVSALLEVGFAG
jgi:hypothetical protein